jgi:hypothetical protein
VKVVDGDGLSEIAAVALIVEDLAPARSPPAS